MSKYYKNNEVGMYIFQKKKQNKLKNVSCSNSKTFWAQCIIFLGVSNLNEKFKYVREKLKRGLILFGGPGAPLAPSWGILMAQPKIIKKKY
jgi:hypothetical protein